MMKSNEIIFEYKQKHFSKPKIKVELNEPSVTDVLVFMQMLKTTIRTLNEKYPFLKEANELFDLDNKANKIFDDTKKEHHEFFENISIRDWRI